MKKYLIVSVFFFGWHSICARGSSYLSEAPHLSYISRWKTPSVVRRIVTEVLAYRNVHGAVPRLLTWNQKRLQRYWTGATKGAQDLVVRINSGLNHYERPEGRSRKVPDMVFTDLQKSDLGWEVLFEYGWRWRQNSLADMTELTPLLEALAIAVSGRWKQTKLLASEKDKKIAAGKIQRMWRARHVKRAEEYQKYLDALASVEPLRERPDFQALNSAKSGFLPRVLLWHLMLKGKRRAYPLTGRIAKMEQLWETLSKDEQKIIMRVGADIERYVRAQKKGFPDTAPHIVVPKPSYSKLLLLPKRAQKVVWTLLGEKQFSLNASRNRQAFDARWRALSSGAKKAVLPLISFIIKMVEEVGPEVFDANTIKGRAGKGVGAFLLFAFVLFDIVLTILLFALTFWAAFSGGGDFVPYGMNGSLYFYEAGFKAGAPGENRISAFGGKS